MIVFLLHSMLAQHLHETSLKGMAFALTDVLASTA
jgi:hypothetical protein